MLHTEEFQVNMGPQHPSTHGVYRAVLKMDGEKVVDIDSQIGYLHRGIEKICEGRNYVQNIPLTDRLDYVSAMSNNIAYCMAIEKLMKVQIPQRASLIRMITAELQRIASHLVFIGTFGLDAGAVTIFLYTFRERELILDLFERLSGARLIYSYMRIGGVAHDLPENFEKDTLSFLDLLEKKIVEYNELLTDNYIFQLRTKGIGPLSKEDALSHGISGPSLRSSGVDYDVRKNDPYLLYEDIDFNAIVLNGGDCFDRYRARILEIGESAKIIRQCIAMLKPGDIKAAVPKLIKPPAGEAYAHVENPRGDLGVYVVSDGSANPYRVKFRAPSFINIGSFGAIGKNHKIADLVVILGSLDPVLGEVDR